MKMEIQNVGFEIVMICYFPVSVFHTLQTIGNYPFALGKNVKICSKTVIDEITNFLNKQVYFFFTELKI